MKRGLKEHFISVQPWAVYVKTGPYFRKQSGLTEKWGKTWLRVFARSIEDARRKGVVLQKKLDIKYIA